MKIASYRGPLSPSQVAEGINAAIANARRLAEDADALLLANRYPSAASLAILSIEEAGKVSILRGLSVARSDSDVRDAWKDYRSHIRKNVAWLLPQLAKAGAKRLDDFRPLFEEGAEHPHLLDNLKQLGFYTDCLGKGTWSTPTSIITKDLAESLVQTARLLSKGEPCSVREIELWVDHIGPVWKQDLNWMKQALVNWYSAMQAAGLKPEGQNQMDSFVRAGLRTSEAAGDRDG